MNALRNTPIYILVASAMLVLIGPLLWYNHWLQQTTRQAQQAVQQNRFDAAATPLTELSQWHYSRERRLFFSNLLLNLIAEQHGEAAMLRSAEAMLIDDADNYHAHYHLGMHYWSGYDSDRASAHLFVASQHPPYAPVYHRFVEWEMARRNTWTEVIKDLIIPSDLLDLLPIGKARKLGKLGKLARRTPAPPRHISEQRLKDNMQRYRQCLQQRQFSAECDGILGSGPEALSDPLIP